MHYSQAGILDFCKSFPPLPRSGWDLGQPVPAGPRARGCSAVGAQNAELIKGREAPVCPLFQPQHQGGLGSAQVTLPGVPIAGSALGVTRQVPPQV